VRWIVLHTTESDIDPAALPDHGAERTAAYFQQITDVSSHYVVDDDSTVQCVSESDEAYTQAPWNRYAISIEQEGRAAFTRDAWLTTHNGLLNQTAALLADITTRCGIPLAWVSGDNIIAAAGQGPAGVTTHVELNKAARKFGVGWARSMGLVPGDYTAAQFFSLTSHTDPGSNYPIDVVLARAAALKEGDDMFVVHVPVVEDGTKCYARFAGPMYTTPTGGLVAGEVVWIDGPTYAAYQRLGVTERSLAVTDFKGVILLGRVPTGDPIHAWAPSDFAQVVGSG
jgi:hypothetical protein